MDVASIDKAFSNQSDHFDAYDQQNPILVWMRDVVHTHVDKFLKPGDHMLELNGGTGMDAVYFAKRGVKVHYTDLSAGMVHEATEKVNTSSLGNQVTIQQCSFTELYQVPYADFDYIFSNFGGLNCADDLRDVIGQFPKLLKPGGYVTLVIMPKVCPWELITLFKGKVKHAFRRFRKNGVKAHLEGEYFMTYYYNPSTVFRYFGNDFKKVKLQGLGAISPPPHSEKVAKRFPAFYRLLTKIDSMFAGIFPFNRWCDHYILTVQYLPKNIN